MATGNPYHTGMNPSVVPESIEIKKTGKLVVHWKDGVSSTYTLGYLRSMCPCAECRTVRQGPPTKPGKKPLLTILPGNYAEPLAVKDAELVGNYGLRIAWSDQHGSGIYSFEYLRSLDAGEGGKSAT